MLKQEETRLHIVDALNGEMKSKLLDKVKVSHLCKRANTSRTTFYSYFKDVFDVVNWYWDYLGDQSLYQIGITLSDYEGHVKNFTLLKDNQELFINAFKSKDYNSVFEYGNRTVKEHFRETAEKSEQRSLTDEEVLWLEFYNYGASSMTKHWIVGGMCEPPETMAALFTSFMPASISKALEVR